MYSNPDQLSQQQRFTAEGVFVYFVLGLALQGAGISQQTSSSSPSRGAWMTGGADKHSDRGVFHLRQYLQDPVLSMSVCLCV